MSEEETVTKAAPETLPEALAMQSVEKPARVSKEKKAKKEKATKNPGFIKQNFMLNPFLGGLAFGILFPLLTWDQAFNTPIGWTFGVISGLIGAMGGLAAGVLFKAE